jgi:hypothetical protein
MSEQTHSVLGRYSPEDVDGELVQVRLLNFPLRLFVQAREHHDELLREFALLALRPPVDRPGHTVPHRLLELVDILGRQYGASSERTDAARDAAIERGEIAADLTYALPVTAGAAVRTLHQLMEEADAFCVAEELLTLAATPLERRFRVWYIQQFVSQLEGAEPVPWDGPMSDDTAF